MTVLTRAGLVPRSWVLITRGRTSGLARSTPVVLVELDGRRWLVAPYGPVSWVLNARAAGRVQLARRRAVRTFGVREVTDPREAAPVLHCYVQIAPATRPYFSADRTDPVDAFLADAADHPVFELLAI
jgi:deazaflavin-dependent oxidoreductase (nitroreductase family)